MRRAASGTGTRTDDRGVGLDGAASLRKRLRRANLRRLAMEVLEERALLATIPAPTTITQALQTGPSTPNNVGNSGGNYSSPTIVINPGNPLQMVEVWTEVVSNPPSPPSVNPSIVAKGKWSADGGANWTAFTPGSTQTDFTSSSTAPTVFPQVTDAGVGIDRDGNVYTIVSDHKADNSAGELLLSKFTFVGASLNSVFANKNIYAWTSNQALKPTIAVDNNVKIVTGQATNQSDPSSGNVYIAWATNDANPANVNNFNPNTIKLIQSADGGANFTAPLLVDTAGNSGGERDTSPRIAISQGSATVTPGQVSVIWDDFGNTAGNNQDAIRISTIQPVAAQVYTNGGGVITDNGSTTFSFTPDVSTNFTVANLQVALALTHPATAELTITLQPPLGPAILLYSGAAPTSDPGGVNMGIGTGGANAFTVFDQNASVPIKNGAAPFIGNFQPAGNLGIFNGLPVQTGTWKLTIADGAANNVGNLKAAALIFTPTPASGPNVSAPRTVTTTNVRGAAGISYARATATDPLGIGPGATIASDVTLGDFSATEGNLYIAYTNWSNVTGNPADNTDVYVVTSTDGGVTWGGAIRVNDDSATSDGFSEASGNTGRAQFQPSIATDPTTGAVVVTYYDGRYDAARSRVATMISTSIDGGGSFGGTTFLNTPLIATDVATNKPVTLGPIPDNESTGNPNRETTLAFGDHQSVAVWGGQVFAVWSSNQNGGNNNLNGNGDLRLLDITLAKASIGAGPRIISGTSGPVGPSTINNSTNPTNGAPGASTFIVTFDRPIAVGSLTANDIVIQARDVNGVLLPTQPTVISINQIGGTANLASQWQITFTADYTPGTVSYAVGPNTAGGTNIADLIKWQTNTQTSTGNAMDQKQNGYSLAGGTYTITQTNSKFSQPTPTNGVPLGGVYDRNSLPLVIPGPYVSGTNMGGQAGDQGTSDNEILNAAPTFMNVVFNQDMLNSSFTPAQILQIVGPAGQLGLPQTFSSGAVNQTIPDNTGQPLNSQILIPPDANSFPISHLSVTVNINHPLDSDLTGYLVSPNNTIITLFQNVGGVNGANFTNTVFDDSASTPISAGTAPFTGTFQPASPLSVLNGTDLSADALHGTWTLRLVDGNGGNVGTLVSWSLTATPSFTVTPQNDGNEAGSSKTFRVGFPQQQLSGTYTISLAPTITSFLGGYQLDQNQNAGVFDLMGFNLDGSTSSKTYSNNTQLVINPQTTLTSTISIADVNAIAGGTLQLNILSSHDPDLIVSLIPPAALSLPPIVLFTNVGSSGTQTNFQNTIFDDAASTFIDNGGAPFLGRFRPENALSALNGLQVTGAWQLQITNTAPVASGRNATLTNWSLMFSKLNLTTGLGEAVADQYSGSFRIFNMDPTNPIATSTWTAVGPASNNGNGNSGRIGGIAVDPSDPSGNTVYIGGASGGVWKTTNFLTTNPGGPTYIPLTNFGETFAMNIGGIAVFPRNGDTRQSVIFAATGEGDTGSTGVGVLRSFDGGLTWQLLDSTVNVDPSGNYLPISSASRDHAFVGSTAFKIMVDPKPTPAGNVIVYMALSGNNGGIWVSYDSGNTWGVFNPATGKRQAELSGQATDITFDYSSGTVDKVANPTGNLQVVYAAIRAKGVYLSSNEGAAWNIMAGGVGDPLIQDASTKKPVTVGPGATPNGAFGRIVLASPAAIPASVANSGTSNFLYAGWLYAVVVTPDSALHGVYLTKDFGQNWTQLQIYTVPPSANPTKERAVPTNNNTGGNVPYDPLSAPPFSGQGNYDVSLGIDPTNPNIIYIGGTTDGPPSGFIRVDSTAVSDPYSFYIGSDRPDGGSVLTNSTAPVDLQANKNPSGLDPRTNPYLNMIRSPSAVLGNSTFYVSNVVGFANNGTDVKWIPFDIGGTDQHRMVVTIDPLTGLPRLIIGDDQGVYTAVDNHGVFSPGIGTAASPSGSRNGNLQITQFYYGAAQPSNAAAQIAGALLYGSAQDDGFPTSSSNVLSSGNIQWGGSLGDATGVATDQTGSGTYYQYLWPCCGGNTTDFFVRNGTGATNGLIQSSGGGNTPDPQWPFVAGFNFSVNPVNGQAVIMGSAAGRFFRTEDGGRNWFVVANPGDLDGSLISAPAFGAPDPVLNNNGSLDDFIYAGMGSGHIFVTTSGGGVSGSSSPWIDITNGDLAGNSSPVQAIVTDPTRGSHRAYAVTSNGVYFIQNSVASYSATGSLIAPATQWVKITGNLFNITTNFFGDPNQNQTQLAYLTSIVADWRYVIPNTFGGPITTDPTLTHPMLYVAGEGGVYRSADNGATWALFPSADPNSLHATTTPPGDGGGIANAHVTDLDLAIGAVDPTTGHPTQVVGDPNVLVATTFGRGDYAIRLAPSVFAKSVGLDPNLPPPTGSDNGRSPTDLITNVKNAVLDGYSEATNFGGHVRITLYDYTNPAAPVLIGGYDGTNATNVAANWTDSAGHFSVQITNTAALTDGVKTIGIQATDDSGTQGNIALFTYTLITQQPTAPTGLSLDGGLPVPNGSDSGVVGDNITNVTSPYFDVTGIENANTPGVTAAAAPFEVFLYRSTSAGGPWTLVNQVIDPTPSPVTPFDTVVIQDPGPLAGSVAGTPYYYYATQQDVAGNTSLPSSPVFKIVVKTSAQTPTGVKLDPNNPAPGGSDTGRSSTDNITNDNTPFINVSSIEVSATTVLLLRSASPAGPFTIVNTESPVVFNGDGTVTIQDPGPAPPDGMYYYEVKQIDVAGNLSPASAALPVLIVTATPATPILKLDPGSDSGALGDNVTNVTSPSLDLTGVATTPPFPADGPYILTLLRATAPGGPFVPVPYTVVSGAGTSSPVLNDAGPLQPDGNYYYEVTTTDVAGNTSTTAVLHILVVAATPSTPGLALDPASDSGVVGDNITNNTKPSFDVSGVTVSPPFPADGPFTLRLLRATSLGGPYAPVPFTVVSGAGTGSPVIRDNGPVQPDGDYYYEVQQVDVAGNPSLPSAPVHVLIVTAIPATATVALDPGSDSGAAGDNITNDTSPSLDLTGVATTPPFPADGPYTITLLRATTAAGPFAPVPYTVVSGGGTSSPVINDAGPLQPDGNYYYKVVTSDVAGNSSTSAALHILVVATAPATPILKLDPASDSGTIGDNITNVTSPAFDLTGVATTPPFPADGPYTLNLLRATTAGGPFVPVPFTVVSGAGTSSPVLRDDGPVQPDGNYYYEVTTTDVAGNTSTTAVLHVLVVTATPATPTMTLDPASDSGVALDNITNVTSPAFDLAGVPTTPPFPADGPYTLNLLRATTAGGPFVPVPFTIVSGAGTSSPVLRDNGPVQPDATYFYEVTTTDVAGNFSTTSLSIKIKTVAQTPSLPVLDPLSDNGPKGDNTTAVLNPSFDVTNIEASAQQVVLLRSTSQAGPFTAVNTMSPVAFTGPGAVTIQDPGPVQPDGIYYYVVKQLDVAGNLSAASPVLAITIDTTPPATPPAAPVLSPVSDSGVSDTDGLTNHDGTNSPSRSLQFTVNVSPAVDTWVRLFEVTSGSPVLVAGPVQAVNGVATLTIAGNTALADGVHKFAATEAANATSSQGPISTSSSVTIQTSTLFNGFSSTSNFYDAATLPSSFTASFNHPIAGLDTGFGSNPYAFMLLPSGPDGQATYNATNHTSYWSAPAGVDSGNLPLHSNLTYHVNGDGSSQITLAPIVPLSTDLYLLSLGGLLDLAGNQVTQNGVAEPFYTSFDYRPTPVDLSTPTITGVTSNNGATTIFPNAAPGSTPLIAQPDTIAIKFSKPMDIYQISSMITLVALPSPGANSVPVPNVVTYSPSTQTAYVTPTATLTPGVKYIVNVSGNLTDDQGFPSPGVPLGVSSSFAFQVNSNPVGRGVAPLRVTATSPANGTRVTTEPGYIAVTFSQPISMQSLSRYSAMLVPDPAAPNNFTPVNAKLAFNPNTNQLIIVPTDALGNVNVDVLSLANIQAALTNGAPNPTDPLLNNGGKPAGVNGNAPYFATFQVLLGGAAAHSVTRQSASAPIIVAPPATVATAGAVVTASAASTTGAPPSPAPAPTDHVSGKRIVQSVAIPKRNHVRLTMHNSARDRGDVVTTALVALEHDRVRPGRWV